MTAIGNLLQLSLYLRRRVGGFEGMRIARTLIRVAFASLLVCGALFSGLVALHQRWHGGIVREGLTVLGAFGFALIAGYGVMKLLRVEELETVESLAGSLRRRLLGR